MTFWSLYYPSTVCERPNKFPYNLNLETEMYIYFIFMRKHNPSAGVDCKYIPGN